MHGKFLAVIFGYFERSLKPQNLDYLFMGPEVIDIFLPGISGHVPTESSVFVNRKSNELVFESV